jgi:hypothetical protein
MANRNRVIYQSEGLFVNDNASSTGAANAEQLGRVQSANYSFTINRQDVNQFGDLARIDSLVLDPPTVSLDFSYYLTDGFNERALGFFVQNSGSTGTNRGINAGSNTEGNFASGHLTANSGVNLYIVTSPDGEDLNKGISGQGEAIDASDTVIGIGNCYVSDYSLDLSVGSLPTVSVTMEGANMRSTSDGSSIINPAINQEDGTAATDTPQAGKILLPNPTENGGITGVEGEAPITALRPGDVSVSLANVAGESLAVIDGAAGAHIQSVSVGLPLSRSPIQRLGSKFPFARDVDFPVDISMSVSAIMNDTHSANLVDILNSGVQTVSFAVNDPDGTTAAIRGTLKGAKLDSESFSSSIGSNKTVDLTFSTQVGGPNDTTNGFFMSGIGFNSIFV